MRKEKQHSVKSSRQHSLALLLGCEDPDQLIKKARRLASPFLLTLMCLTSGDLDAATYLITDPGDTPNFPQPGTLRYLINQANQDNIPGSSIINTAGSFFLNGNMPVITVDNLTVDFSGSDLNGGTGSTKYQAFVVYGPSQFTLQNINLFDTTSLGGTGGTGSGGGGGGLGAGGGLFVGPGTNVTVTNVLFDGCQALGGTGGAATNTVSGVFGGGGGGSVGATANGGAGDTSGSATGGAGGGGSGYGLAFGGNGNDAGGGGGGSLGGGNGSPPPINGQDGSGANGGSGGQNNGSGGGVGGNAGTPSGGSGTNFGGGGGGFGIGGNGGTSQVGGGGGGGAGNNTAAGGLGGSSTVAFGAGGGGGGANVLNGGTGIGGAASDYAGGGGGGASPGGITAGGAGGLGGFGGGGGGAGYQSSAAATLGGLFGGAGGINSGGGGGGAGLGGNVFYDAPGQTLTFVNPIFATPANSVVGGAGGASLNGHPGSPGTALGRDIYMTSGSTVAISSTNGTAINIFQISGDQGQRSSNTGGGVTYSATVPTTFMLYAGLASTTNTYSGTTTIGPHATVSFSADTDFGSTTFGPGNIVFAAPGGGSLFLNLTSGGVTTGRNFTFNGTNSILLDETNVITYTINGTVSDGTIPGVINLVGPGTLLLTNTNSFTGGVLLTNEAILEANGNQALGTGPITFNDNSSPSCVLHLLGSDTYANAINLPFNGIIKTDSGTTNTIAGPLEGTATFSYNGADLTSSLLITNDAGAGFTGPVELLGGILKVSGTQPVGSGLVTAFGGSIGFPANSTMSNDFNLVGVSVVGQQIFQVASNATATLTGQISGGAPIIFDGPGTLFLNTPLGNNLGNFITVNGGTIQSSGLNPFGGGLNTFVYNGGNIKFTGTGNYGNAFFEFNNPATIQLTNGSVSNVAAEFKGTVPVTIQGTGGILNFLSSNDQFTGGFTLDSGTVTINNINGLGVGGITQFNGGTLELTTSLAFIGPVPSFNVTSNGGTIVLDEGTSSNFSFEPIHPSTLTGTGTLNFSYRGTGVNLGTLDITNLNATGFSGTYAINAGANLEDTNSSNLNPSSPFFFNGGQFSLLGSSNYSNPIFLSLGNGTFFSTNGPNTLSGNITGPGALGVFASGNQTLILSGANTYQGGTRLAGGVLQTTGINPMGTGTLEFAGGNLTLTGNSSISTPVLFNASTTLTATNATLSALLYGPSGFSFQGGTLNITSQNNTYQGGTFISTGVLKTSGNQPLGTGTVSLINGSLELTSSTNLPNTFLLVNNNPIQTDSGTTTIGGGISGLGSAGLIKTGNGTLVLNGAGSYTGPTIVSAGTLQVNSSLTSPVTVNSGTTLQGVGTIAAPVSISGTLAPGIGTSPLIEGTLTAGNVTFNPGSNFQVLLDGPLQGKLVSTGNVTIGSNVALSPTINPVYAAQYVIIQSAGSVTGQFNPFSFQTLRSSASVLYFPNQVIVDVAFIPFAHLLPRGNLQNIGACFDQAALTPSTDMTNVLTTLNTLSLPEIVNAFSQIDPSFYNAIQFAEESASEKVRNSYTQHTYERVWDPEYLNDMFVTFFGGQIHQDSFGNIPSKTGYDDIFSGFILGFDRFLNQNLLAGTGFSYSRSRLDFSHANARSTLNSYTGYIGATWLTTNLILDAYGSYTFHVAQGSKNIFIPPGQQAATPGSPFNNSSLSSINRKMKFKGDGECYTSHVGALIKQTIDRTPFYLLAYADVDYLWVNQQPFKEENGGVLGLHIHSKKADLLRPESGFGFGVSGTLLNAEMVFCEVDVAYVGMFRFQGKRTEANFTGNSCVFHVNGIKPNHNLVRPTLRFGISSMLGLDVAFNYSGAFGNRYSENEGKIELTYLF